ncbi:hypothetical protein ACN20G_28655 (plasmid) [Streptomyces sp. BI20]|uniref:hypothetical protein n=1 Tax=Streptomyces sp. BI20 TaxID=3403460 RepID=UPI003C757741
MDSTQGFQQAAAHLDRVLASAGARLSRLDEPSGGRVRLEVAGFEPASGRGETLWRRRGLDDPAALTSVVPPDTVVERGPRRTARLLHVTLPVGRSTGEAALRLLAKSVRGIFEGEQERALSLSTALAEHRIDLGRVTALEDSLVIAPVTVPGAVELGKHCRTAAPESPWVRAGNVGWTEAADFRSLLQVTLWLLTNSPEVMVVDLAPCTCCGHARPDRARVVGLTPAAAATFEDNLRRFAAAGTPR